MSTESQDQSQSLPTFPWHILQNSSTILDFYKAYYTQDNPEAANVTSDKLGNDISQVIVDYLRCGVGLTGEGAFFEIFLSLWKGGFQLTEEYGISIPVTSTSSKAIFRNVEVTDGVVMICRVMRLVSDLDDRKSAILNVTSAAAARKLYRRPFCIGALPLSDALSAGNTSNMVFYSVSSYSDFADAPLLLSQGRQDIKMPQCADGSGVSVDFAVKCIPGIHNDGAPMPVELSSATVCNIMHPGKLPIPFPSRNDIYVTLESGKFSQGKNIEVKAFVRDDEGAVIEKCITVGSQAVPQTEYNSPVWTGQSSVVWRETFRVRIPNDELLEKTHLYFNFYHVTNRQDKEPVPFGFAFKRFTVSRGALVPDGACPLEIFKVPPGTVKSVPVKAYINAASSSGASAAAAATSTATTGSNTSGEELTVRKGESLQLRFKSFAHMPNDSKIASVLQWRDCESDPKELEMRLTALTITPANEVVHFLPQLLHAFFDMFQSTSVNPSLAASAFNTLVEILKSLADERAQMYSLHRELIESLIDSEFSVYTTAHVWLLQCLNNVLQSSTGQTTTQTAKGSLLLQCLKVLPLLMHFIVASRLYVCYSNHAAPQTDIQFKTQIVSLFDKLSYAIMEDNETCANARTLSMRIFDETLSAVSKFFSPAELAAILANFAGNLVDSRPSFLCLRTQMIYRAVGPDSLIGFNDETVRTLMPFLTIIICQHTETCLPLEEIIVGYMRTCQNTAILQQSISELATIFCNNATLVRRYYGLLDDHAIIAPPEAESSVATIYNKMLTEKQLAVFLYIWLFSLIHSMNALLYPLYILEQQQYGGDHNVAVRHFIGDICEIFVKIMDDESLFPRKWNILNVVVQQTMLQAVFFVKDYYVRGGVEDRIELCAPETPEADEEMTAFRHFLTLCFSLLSGCKVALSSEPKLETLEYVIPFINDCFPRIQRKIELIPVLQLALNLLEFTPEVPQMESFVGSFVGSIWIAEYEKTQKFTRTMATACDFVDQAIRRNKSKPEVLRHFFSEVLASIFKGSDNKEMQEQATEVLNSVMNLLQLVIEFMGLPSGPEFAEERAIATIKMMSYFQNTEQSAYFRYVQTLYNEHMCAEPPSYVEAACTVLQHAVKLPWTDEQLPQMTIDSNSEPLPAEKSWERRKRLYTLAINCYDHARLYERSIQLYHELMELHRKRKEFALMSSVLLEEAKEFEELDAASDAKRRVLPPFFLICYSGNGFPVSVANRRFVQRADTEDTAETVASRLKRKFPDAVMRTSSDANNGVLHLDDLAGESNVVAILPLRPSSEGEAAGFETLFPPRMPAATRQYQLFNNTCMFTQPEREDPDGNTTTTTPKDDDVRHFFVTEEPFPSTRRSVEVIRTIERKQTPLLREISYLTSHLNDADLHVLAFSRTEKHSDEILMDFSKWAAQALSILTSHVRDVTIPQFIKTEFTGDEAKLQERVRVLLTRLCNVTRELVIAHNKEAISPARISIHARLCDQAAEFLRLASSS